MVRRSSNKAKPPVAPSSQLGARPVAPPRNSRSRTVAAVSDLDPITSGEEFVFQEDDDVEEEDNIPDLPAPVPPPDSLPVLVPQTKNKKAYDIKYFFMTVEYPTAENANEKVQKACKICHKNPKNHGTDAAEGGEQSEDNYLYKRDTGTANLRNHLIRLHAKEYDEAINKFGWNYPLSTMARGVRNPRKLRDPDIPLYTPETFLDALVRLIVADDQSIRVIECPEFRRLCMILRESLVDADIPRRDKMREAILNQFWTSFNELKVDLSRSVGRISFTADIWSDANLAGYLAVTAHWISIDESNGRLSLRCALIGFHRLMQKHTGSNIAQAILDILDRAGVTLKIGWFTLDNAESNNTAMDELQTLLNKRGTVETTKFDPVKQRIRCYAHIINICSGHIIAAITPKSKSKSKSKSNDTDDESADSESDTDDDELELPDIYDLNPEEWLEGIKRNPLMRARRIIRLIRSSDQRREAFRTFIDTGNSSELFTARDASGQIVLVQVQNLQLLRDVKTRWDSVYLMLQRLRQLRPALDLFFESNVKMQEFKHFKLTESDWEILEGLEFVLLVPHKFQQTMSSESMPTLSNAIRSFEMFMTNLENVGDQYELLKPWTDIGLQWATKYYIRMDDTDAYVVTMFLNPNVRLSWMEEQWEGVYFRNAKEIILDLMRRYRSKTSSMPATTISNSPVKRAPVAKGGIPPTRFKIRLFSYEKSTTSLPASTIEAEFNKYASARSTGDTDILQFWEVNKCEFPTLFAIAMDYLPIQATSVPCERVFSSSKETDTAKRNSISPVLMEALQILKFSLKKERLNFTAGWSTSKVAMMGVPEPTGTLGSLFVGDRDTALDRILNDISALDQDEADQSDDQVV